MTSIRRRNRRVRDEISSASFMSFSLLGAWNCHVADSPLELWCLLLGPWNCHIAAFTSELPSLWPSPWGLELPRCRPLQGENDSPAGEMNMVWLREGLSRIMTCTLLTLLTPTQTQLTLTGVQDNILLSEA